MINPLDKFLEMAQDRFASDSSDMTNGEWVIKNTTIRNRSFSFKGYEFQEQIMNDMHPDMCCIKISQVGMTEVQIRKSLAFLLRNPGTSLIFSLPTEEMFKRLSGSRVKPIVNKDKVFNTLTDKENKAVRSVGLFQFGQSFLYLVPAIESAATSIPADVVMNDEVDLSDQQMMALFGSRMQNSSHKINQKFSTPSYPSYGIDAGQILASQDQYHKKDRMGSRTSD